MPLIENNHPLVITVSREYGSGGHKVGEAIAKTFDTGVFTEQEIANIVKELSARRKN